MKEFLISEATSRLRAETGGEGVGVMADAFGIVEIPAHEIEKLCVGAYLIGYGHAVKEMHETGGYLLLEFMMAAEEQPSDG